MSIKLTEKGVFDVFAFNNGLSFMGADLTYLNFVVGVLCMFAYQPVQDWLYRRGLLPAFRDLIFSRCGETRRQDPSRSSIPYIPCHGVAFPRRAFLVRVHLRRQCQLLVSNCRWWSSWILWPYSVACHVELYHGFVSICRCQCDRCVLVAQFHNCCGAGTCGYCHVRQHVYHMGGISPHTDRWLTFRLQRLRSSVYSWLCLCMSCISSGLGWGNEVLSREIQMQRKKLQILLYKKHAIYIWDI